MPGNPSGSSDENRFGCPKHGKMRQLPLVSTRDESEMHVVPMRVKWAR